MKKYFIILFVLINVSVFANNSTIYKQSLKSLILPAYGEKDYNKTAFYSFLGTEIFISANTIFDYYSKEKYFNDAIDYASLNINKNVSLFPDRLLLKMEYYVSSDEYNAILPLKARDLYPDDIEKQKEYIEENTVPDSLSWDWGSEETMEEYYDMKKNSRMYEQIFLISASALVINHLSSFIFTYFDVKSKINIDIIPQGYIINNNYNIKLTFNF